MSMTESQSLRMLKPCALCRTAQSTSNGEHVLPKWLKKKVFLSSGQYTTTYRDGRTITQAQFDSVILPCCSACNGTLEQRFEGPNLLVIPRLLSTPRPDLSPDEASNAALWLLKTFLLLVHPRSEFQRATPQPLPWDDAPPEVFEWLINGDAPPDGLSMWCFRYDRNTISRAPAAPVLYLPTVIADGRTRRFLACELRIALIDVAVVWHPGWPIEHPSEQSRQVRRFWPIPRKARLRELPVLDSPPIQWRTGGDLTFLSHAYHQSRLPPLTPGTRPEHTVQHLLWQFHAPETAGP